MDRQLVAFNEAHVNPAEYAIAIENRSYFNKPSGAVWSSTWLGDKHGSDWIQWCLQNEFHSNPFHCYLLTPAPDVRILTIDCYMRLLHAFNRYRREDDNYPTSMLALLDFEAIADNYDAIHLTETGQWETRYTRPSLYGWDCESTCWLRKCWTVEDIGVMTFEIQPE